MERELIVPDDMKNIVDRFNYSPAVRVGNLLYCAGQVGRDSNLDVINSSLEDHIVMAWENVGKVLKAGGSDYEHIIEMTTYHVDLQEQLSLFLEIRGRYIKRGPVPPAWTAIGITELTFPGELVEIKVVALVP